MVGKRLAVPLGLSAKSRAGADRTGRRDRRGQLGAGGQALHRGGLVRGEGDTGGSPGRALTQS